MKINLIILASIFIGLTARGDFTIREGTIKEISFEPAANNNQNPIRFSIFDPSVNGTYKLSISAQNLAIQLPLIIAALNAALKVDVGINNFNSVIAIVIRK